MLGFAQAGLVGLLLQRRPGGGKVPSADAHALHCLAVAAVTQGGEGGGILEVQTHALYRALKQSL